MKMTWHISPNNIDPGRRFEPSRKASEEQPSVLLNNANQLLISLAGQLTHPNVSGTVLVVTYPDDHPRHRQNHKQKGMVKIGFKSGEGEL